MMTKKQRWGCFSRHIQKPAAVVLLKKKSSAEITSASDVPRESEHRAVRSVIRFS